jgi:ABC-type sugar transport system ATPase subunit
LDENKVLLTVKNITKSFPGVKALESVDFDLKSGEVHALVGENGAGKSTLIKIISGVYQKNEGELTVKGQAVNISDSHHARSLGIGVIFQELSLVPTLSVAENIYLGNEIVKSSFFLDRKQMFRETGKMLKQFNIELDPRETVANLSTAKQQVTEIFKALSLNPKILIMDEPTASLSDADTEILFKIVQDLKKKGVGIIYVTHKMNEVFKLADRVAILRDGKLIDDLKIGKLNLDKIVKLMVGRAVELYKSSYKDENKIKNKKVKFEVRNLSRENVFNNISFKLHEGEILGIAGLVGSGRSEVMRSIFRIDKNDSGEIFLDGSRVEINSVKEAIDLGIAMLPENRKLQGLIMMHDVERNITLPIMKQFVSSLLIKNRSITDFAVNRIKEIDLRPEDPKMIVQNLSGGNQQKVCIAKWLSTKPKVLIVDEPTVGIDVKTKSEIHKLFRKLTEEGVSIIMVSSEMPELLAHCDRILVMNNGCILGDFYNDRITHEDIMSMIVEDIMDTGKNSKNEGAV